MWNRGWRDRAWSSLDQKWDLIIIGGGITGAGILLEASRAGLRSLLVEANDFAAGTSSRSSKLVHGGFRYLKNAQVKLTVESVHERERLIKEGRGLINSLGFLMPSYRGDRIPTWMMGLGLTIYDLIAMKWSHRYYDAYDLRELCPFLNEYGLLGGYRFFDAQTDDARLVLRLLREAVQAGGLALNYVRACGLLKTNKGEVCGVVLQDMAPNSSRQDLEVQAALVINATGAWADELRHQVGQPDRLRRLRGSHLILPIQRLPLTRAVSLWHPVDRRPVFAFPWEGVILIGTTDVEHPAGALINPSISMEEANYLMDALRFAFPGQGLSLDDVISTFSGVRSVVDTGKADPSKESREHAIWCEKGLLTVTGGKLTTFRLMANAALKAACSMLPGNPRLKLSGRALQVSPADEMPVTPLSKRIYLRLLGRYGGDAPHVLASSRPEELREIPGTTSIWAELRWAARAEGVVHLEDLLLRRVRLGLVLPCGGAQFLGKIRHLVQGELGWDDTRWYEEVRDYQLLWQHSYSLSGMLDDQTSTDEIRLEDRWEPHVRQT